MLKDHPTAEDFEKFLRGASGQGATVRNARILRHLLADCTSCRHRLVKMGWAELRLERLLCFPIDQEERSNSDSATSYDYSRAFAAAQEALSAFCIDGRPAENTAEELLAELAPMPQDEQLRRIRAYSRFANPQLVRK